MEIAAQSVGGDRVLDGALGHRDQGDGAPVPRLPGEISRDHRHDNQNKPFSVKAEFDLMQLALTLVTLATRIWHISFPHAVVFDELHFAKFASLYLKKVFFFDVHPPLGKILLAAAAEFGGYNGNASFDRIGAEYPPDVPVFEMRLVPAVLGSLITPLVYEIAVELRLSRWAAAIAGAFILLDNALLVQSRFMLMEGMLIFFSCLSIMSYLKLRKLSLRAFSLKWWFWMALCGISFTCSASIKYVGCFTAVLVLFLAFRDLWNLLEDPSYSEFSLIKHCFARFCLLVGVPICLYVSLFYFHLSVLTKAGPHDNIMTSAFQASLEGGLAALTKGQPLYVSYGSQITLRHTHDAVPGRPCWLHSHQAVYPIRYPDNRGSSHQQQVTCYIFKDVNNWWIIKHPKRDSLVVDEMPQPVKHGDIIQLVHGITSRALNSHDVAAPVSPQNQEVSCYIDYNVSMPAQNLWRVDIVNRESDSDNWQTIKSQIRLIHVNTSTAIRSTGKQLPEWGFHQLEVAADRVINQPAAVWNVEEHRYTKNVEKDRQSQSLRQAEMIPLEPTRLSFWTKFWELQLKMIFSSQDVELEHKYCSDPLDWPFMTKNIAYWMSPNTNAQIHLLGNVVIWKLSFLGLCVYLGLLIFYILRRRREVFDMPEADWIQFLFVSQVVIGGYLLNYLPYFLSDRTLFLHHYLPAVIFKILAFAVVIDHIYKLYNSNRGITTLVIYVTLAILSSVVYVFVKLAVFSYGTTALSPSQMQELTWKETWDFLIHAKTVK
ncbi:protein O-mannosyl-transferase 1-like [Gigantopelta aegis]|uniref:protein O-mannosyl-transferase 1-like n=1 Tax=Gigantopelta aegis TaxID=1735272 RepID=UPI001B889ED9|nr:protein O-mannosyl-transferase 1-like [Gigantopelta aegis]XP_041368199.1 protein O-mannosyl-transferase 1-like [Gigantopelta aegis]